MLGTREREEKKVRWPGNEKLFNVNVLLVHLGIRYLLRLPK